MTAPYCWARLRSLGTLARQFVFPQSLVVIADPGRLKIARFSSCGRARGRRLAAATGDDRCLRAGFVDLRALGRRVSRQVSAALLILAAGLLAAGRDLGVRRDTRHKRSLPARGIEPAAAQTGPSGRGE